MNIAQKKIKGNSSNNIILQNRYAVLAAENDKIKVDDSDNSESSEENSENAKKVTKAKFFVKYKKERVELHTSTLEDFNHIKEKWVRDNIKFYTYTTKGDKRKTYVMYRMHYGITVEEIKLELEDLNIVVYNVNAMRGTSRPMFMVTTIAATKLAQLQDKVRYHCYMKVTWDYYRSNKRLIQCHMCQEWGHATTNFYAKCAGEHDTKQCTKPKDTPAKCFNCEEDHPANATICKAYLDITERIEARKTNNKKDKSKERQVPDINNIKIFPWRKQLTHQPAVNPRTKAKDWSNKHNIQRNEGQSNSKSFFSTSNNDINNAYTVNFRPSNVSNSLDNFSNNQNVTSTDGITNLRKLAHEIQEINKICNIIKSEHSGGTS
ncbi:hypothetical protein M0802_015269 [Mischocyttarus mexicanus]|nr:hypothetical protein M0802_015269 [Mischocyttarus mexicanus]